MLYFYIPTVVRRLTVINLILIITNTIMNTFTLSRQFCWTCGWQMLSLSTPNTPSPFHFLHNGLCSDLLHILCVRVCVCELSTALIQTNTDLEGRAEKRKAERHIFFWSGQFCSLFCFCLALSWRWRMTWPVMTLWLIMCVSIKWV